MVSTLYNHGQGLSEIGLSNWTLIPKKL